MAKNKGGGGKGGGGKRGGSGFSAKSVQSIVRSVAGAVRGRKGKGVKKRAGFRRGFSIVPSMGTVKTLAVGGAFAAGGFIAAEKVTAKMIEKFPDAGWLNDPLKPHPWGRVGVKVGVGVLGATVLGNVMGKDKAFWFGGGAVLAAALDLWDHFVEADATAAGSSRINGSLAGVGSVEYRPMPAIEGRSEAEEKAAWSTDRVRSAA